MNFDTPGRKEQAVRTGAADRPGRRVQLHRAVAKLGWGSRTQAWEWIRAGQVRVDGHVITDPLTWVDLDRQQVTRGGEEAPQPARVVLALHKPRGVVTTRSDERGRPTVYDLLPSGLPWVFPAGRLDADSEGLLILTNDAALAVRLTEPEQHVAKTYRVTVAGSPDEVTLQRLREGVELADGRTRPAEVRLLSRRRGRSLVEMVLTEGRNRQVRRMWAAEGHKVRRLVRVAIGALPLADLPPGGCRPLAPGEIHQLLGAAAP
jgi:23S rRNA pseudouridine2605 synthase